jgi:hypothetical protein
MAIINDYEAIARRVCELNPTSGREEEPKNWRDLAEETARRFVENRRQGLSQICCGAAPGKFLRSAAYG